MSLTIFHPGKLRFKLSTLLLITALMGVASYSLNIGYTIYMNYRVYSIMYRMSIRGLKHSKEFKKECNDAASLAQSEVERKRLLDAASAAANFERTCEIQAETYDYLRKRPWIPQNARSRKKK